jgi:hypothetical protein
VLKKSITYENPFTEQNVTQDFWFHISKADLARMEVEEHKEVFVDKDGKRLTGMQAKMQRIVEAEDGKALMPLFEDIIRRAYGRRDGDRFMRSEEIWQDFKGSGAFDELLFELCTNAEKSAEFINGVMPGNLQKIAAEMQAEAEALNTAASKKPAARKRAAKKAAESTTPFESSERSIEIAEAKPEFPVILTQEEMVEMAPEELQEGLASGKFKLS